MKEKIWFWSSLKQSLSYYLFSSNCTFSIFKTYKNAAFTASHRFCIQNFIYTLSRETRILKITKKYYYQACKLLPYSCLISQEVRRKQSLHCCEKQYLYKNRFFFFVCKSLRHNTCLDIHFQKLPFPCLLGIAKYTSRNFLARANTFYIRKKEENQLAHHLFGTFTNIQIS